MRDYPSSDHAPPRPAHRNRTKRHCNLNSRQQNGMGRNGQSGPRRSGKVGVPKSKTMLKRLFISAATLAIFAAA